MSTIKTEQEINIETEHKRQCKNCLLFKPRIRAGMYPDERNFRWVDANDRLWNGRLCPDCNAIRAKSTMQKIRSGADA